LASLAAPKDLRLTAAPTTVTLNWKPIPAIPEVGCRFPGSSTPDLGYRVYYRARNPCPPFDGAGADQGTSPIDVEQATAVRLSGLGKDVFYVVTAYDFLGRESLYSNVVTPPRKNYLPLVLNKI
jgi:hypothetical protein